MIDTIRLQAALMQGPDRRSFLLVASAFAILVGAGIWLLPSSDRMMLWGGLVLLAVVMVPVLWREGHTWVILWLAPVAAIDPFPDPLIRAAKYALVLTAVAIAILKRRIDRPPAAFYDARPFYAGIALLGWFWIRAVTGDQPWDGSFEALRMTLVAALIYLWLSEQPAAGGRRRWYVLWVLMGMYQIAACLVESIMWGRIRSYGTFASPNSLGAYLVVTLALVFCAAMWAPSRRARVWSRAAFLVLMFGLYLTGSRASWLGAAISIMVIVVVGRHWKLLSLGVVTLGLVAGVYFTNPVINFAINAALRVEGGLTHRPMLWDASDRAIRKAPWLGYGVDGGGDPMAAEARYPSRGHRHLVADIVEVGSPHNFYRELTIETGLIGLALLGAVILTLIRYGYRKRRSPDPWRSIYAWTLLATTIGIAVHSYFERSVFMGSMSAAVFYWFVAAQTARPDDPGTSAAPASVTQTGRA